jgi:hypothetical protein
VSATPCGALGHEHRLQRRDIIGQRIMRQALKPLRVSV